MYLSSAAQHWQMNGRLLGMRLREWRREKGEDRRIAREGISCGKEIEDERSVQPPALCVCATSWFSEMHSERCADSRSIWRLADGQWMVLTAAAAAVGGAKRSKTNVSSCWTHICISLFPCLLLSDLTPHPHPHCQTARMDTWLLL